MQIREPVGHGSIVARLWEATSEGRLPHALLFEGDEGIGKFLAAKWLAAGLLCAEGPGVPCGVCGPCKRVRSGGEEGNHPDLFVVDPLQEGEEQIRVHRIAYRPSSPNVADPERCVEHFLDLHALEGRGRVVIIRESHRMNTSSQNSLLKTLEEPRPGTRLLLETHRSELLLPTIKSRCVRIRFEPLDDEACRGVLEEQGLEGEGALRLARWGEGSPGRALALGARAAVQIREHVAQVLQGRTAAWTATRELFELEGAFEGRTPNARARDRARTILDLVLAVVRDVLRAAEGMPVAELPHGDLVAVLGPGMDPRREERRLRSLLTARGDIERNLAPDAVVERALLALGDEAPILAR